MTRAGGAGTFMRDTSARPPARKADRVLRQSVGAEYGSPLASPKVRTQFRVVQEILTNVRWNYGPPENVTRVEP